MSWAIIPSRSSIAVCISAGLFAASVGMVVDATRLASNAVRDTPEHRPTCEGAASLGAPSAAEGTMIVDVSHRALALTGTPLSAMVGLGDGDELVAIGGRSAIGWSAPSELLSYELSTAEPGDYLDLEIAPADGAAHRRVLVIIYP